MKLLTCVVLLVTHPALGYELWPFCDRVLRHFRLRNGQLHRYRHQDVASCLDSLQQHWIHGKLHLMFIGDSRIRQHFFSFVQAMPDYDLAWRGDFSNRGEFRYSRIFRSHNDLHAASRLLNVVVSFKWRPTVDQQLLSEMRQYHNSTSKRPNFILMGISGHHMLRENGADIQGYGVQLKKLRYLLGPLTKHVGIVWLHQYPIVEMFGVTGTHNTDIHSQKVHQYNQIANAVLRDSGVEVWNSSNFLVEEDIRGCSLNTRSDAKEFHNCRSFIHAGFSGVDATTQILLNYMCNGILFQCSSSAVHLPSESGGV